MKKFTFIIAIMLLVGVIAPAEALCAEHVMHNDIQSVQVDGETNHEHSDEHKAGCHACSTCHHHSHIFVSFAKKDHSFSSFKTSYEYERTLYSSRSYFPLPKPPKA